MERRRILIIALCATLLLTGCVSSSPVEKTNSGQTLPTIRLGPDAPIGDSRSAYETDVLLYLPDANGTRLSGTTKKITIEANRAAEQTVMEACIEALLSEVNASDFYQSDQELRLATVSNPVETTGELATVNLHYTVQSMSREKRFALWAAITNTLTEFSGINYVSILVNGRDMGLDVIRTLPTGALARYTSGDISTYWSQIVVQVEETSTALQKSVALYFVGENGSSLLGEVRSITFTQRSFEAYALVLMEEMAIGSTKINGSKTVVPGWEYLERDPIYDASSQSMRLDFSFSVDDFLLINGYTREMLLSSICYTLTSFIPELNGIVVYIGGDLVTNLEGIGWSAANGLLRREDVSAFAADTCTVYFPNAEGTKLVATQRPIAQRQRTQPRAFLRELMVAPTDSRLSAALPEGITDADILGLQILGDTALVNLSTNFAQACEGMDATQERNMIYAMVNTLTELDGVSRVRFYVNGKQESLAGHLFIEGEFLRNTGIIGSW